MADIEAQGKIYLSDEDTTLFRIRTLRAAFLGLNRPYICNAVLRLSRHMETTWEIPFVQATSLHVVSAGQRVEVSTSN